LKQKSVKPAFQAYKDPEENGSTNPPRVTNRLPPQSRVLKETKHPPVPSNPLSNEVYYHPNFGYTTVSMDLPRGTILGYDHRLVYPEGRGAVFQPPELEELTFEELRANLPKYQPQPERHDDSLEFTCVARSLKVQQDEVETETRQITVADQQVICENPAVATKEDKQEEREYTITRFLNFEDITTGQVSKQISVEAAHQQGIASSHADIRHNISSQCKASVLEKDVSKDMADSLSGLNESYSSLAIKHPNNSRLSVSRLSESSMIKKPSNSAAPALTNQMPEREVPLSSQRSQKEAPSPGNSPTMTINTRYAMEAVQNMFDCSLSFARPVALSDDQRVFEEQFKLPEKQATPNQVPFTVFQDPEQDDDNAQRVTNDERVSSARLENKTLHHIEANPPVHVLQGQENQQEETRTSIRGIENSGQWLSSTPAVRDQTDINWPVSRIWDQMESQMTHTFKKSAMSVPQLSPVEERSKESYSSSSSSSANKSGRCIDPFEPQFHESMLKLVPKHFWDNKKYRECNDCESQLCLKKLEKTCMTLGEFTLRFEKKIGSGNYATVYLATVVESHTLTDSEGIKKAVKVSR
jgi:hypothetical protein